MNRLLRISNLVATFGFGLTLVFLIIGFYYDNLYIGLIAIISAFTTSALSGHLKNKRVLEREASMKYGSEI